MQAGALAFFKRVLSSKMFAEANVFEGELLPSHMTFRGAR